MVKLRGYNLCEVVDGGYNSRFLFQVKRGIDIDHISELLNVRLQTLPKACTRLWILGKPINEIEAPSFFPDLVASL